MGYCALRTARKVATESLARPQRHNSLHSFIAIFPISPSQRQCILFLSSERWSWFSSVFSIDSEHNVISKIRRFKNHNSAKIDKRITIINFQCLLVLFLKNLSYKTFLNVQFWFWKALSICLANLVWKLKIANLSTCKYGTNLFH